MKKLLLIIIAMTLITCVACSPSSTSKKITLADAPDILNVSLLLPSRFEQVDAASEGMSNKDFGLGSDFSEVKVYMSGDPFQMIWGFMAIIESRVEAATFDRQLEDESTMKNLIEESILEGARGEGYEATVTDLNITHPDVGDSAIFGEGYMESYGFYYGFDILCFRINKVYVYLYSTSMSSDEVDLLTISKEIEKRIGQYSQ